LLNHAVANNKKYYRKGLHLKKSNLNFRLVTGRSRQLRLAIGHIHSFFAKLPVKLNLRAQPFINFMVRHPMTIHRPGCPLLITVALAAYLVAPAVLFGKTFPMSPSSQSAQPTLAKGDWTKLTGYADRFSAQPGETLKFMVSTEFPRFRADIVRLSTSVDPKNLGFKDELVDSPANHEYPGRRQALNAGSYVMVPDAPALRLTGSFTIQAWVAPSTPHKGVQGIVTKWSASEHKGYALVIENDGSLGLWIGDKNGHVVDAKTAQPLRDFLPASRNIELGLLTSQMATNQGWYFVAATFDAAAGTVTLYEQPVSNWPEDDTRVVTTKVSVKAAGESMVPLLMAAFWDRNDGKDALTGGHLNGKIDSPRVFNRALSRDEIDALARGGAPMNATAAWDFSADIESRKVTDTSANKLNGETVNMPARAMMGYNWSGRELRFSLARAEYGAIYFHDDDMDDARWKTDFELTLPVTLKSGIYAARIRSGNREDHIPFFVRPKKGSPTARIAFLAPTFSYLAYANWTSNVPQLLSLYSTHSDGSGVFYTSRLRPIQFPYSRTFEEDLYLIDWLEAKGLPYDVITDDDLNAEGTSLLAPYKVIITSSHPEYWSTPMMDATQGYLNQGGRLMYLGGNGFYWVTSKASPDSTVIEVRRNHGTATWVAAPGEYFHSTTDERGGLWRFRGRPPQQMVGVGFTAQGSGRGRPFLRQPTSFDPEVAFIFNGIGPNEMIGNFPSLVREYGAASDELDRLDYALGSPPNALVVATATGFSNQFQHATEEVQLPDARQGGDVNPLVKADMVFLEYPNGGAVFSVGTISWDAALSYNNYNNTVSKITENVVKQFMSDLPLSAPH
jgi:N,N-dimethylformamidase